jgi:hypothetical protein
MQLLLRWKNLRSIKYSERVFVALGTQHAMRLSHIFTCGVNRSKVFFYFIS